MTLVFGRSSGIEEKHCDPRIRGTYANESPDGRLMRMALQ
jgi:hypothetical protein